MNATQDASNKAQNDINRKLISYNETQNEIIFSTRKRLFSLEHKQKTERKPLQPIYLILLLCNLPSPV